GCECRELRASRRRPLGAVRRGPDRQGGAEAGRRVHLLRVLPGAPPQQARGGIALAADLPRLRLGRVPRTARAAHAAYVSGPRAGEGWRVRTGARETGVNDEGRAMLRASPGPRS